MAKGSEIIVVGGGINGVSTAYNLAENGVEVTLVEKEFVAGGPSGVSSAIVRQHYSNPVTARMALESLRVWQNFSEKIGGEKVFTETEFLLGVRPEDVAGLKANITMQQSVGINTRFVSPEQIQDLEPDIDPSGLGGAAYEPEAGYCDPAEAANGFARAAARAGAQIRSGVTVTGLRSHAGVISGVETDQGFLPAGKVVVIAGPWTPHLLRPLGVDLPISTARVKVVLFRRPAELNIRRIWADFIIQVYLRPETGGQILVGSIAPEEETSDQISDPDNFSDKVAMDLIASFAERVARRYPGMERGHLASSYASLYDLTPDWHPIMDAVPGYTGLYVFAGTSGHGFKLAPAAGRMMAQLVLKGKQPDDPVSLFALDRFERGAPVHGQYEYSILG